MNTIKAPKTAEEFSQYFNFRWKILRQPWQQAQGSEQDEKEQNSIHRMILDEQFNVIAVGRLEKVSDQQGQIRYMAVDDNVQRQGFGQQILQALEQQARMLGMTEIIINAREHAIEFYQQYGYKKQNYSHTLFDEIKHFSMIKKLEPHAKHQLAKAQALQTIWHNTIPLSKAMNLQISFYDATKLITRCDADFNQNLHHTMFAGSIYTLATLTGWGWVYLALKAEQEKGINIEGDIVLADANIRYHSPIKGLTYGQVEQTEVTGQLDNLLQGKNARMKLTAHVYCGDKIGATFTGSYFILPKNSHKNER